MVVGPAPHVKGCKKDKSSDAGFFTPGKASDADREGAYFDGT